SGSEKESEARKLLKKRLGEITLGRFIGPDAERVTIRELAQDYLNDYRINRRKSIDKAERMVTRIDEDGKETDSDLMVYFGDCKAHSVGADTVKKYVSRRLEAGAANASINRELAALKRMYSLGLEAEKIYRKPHIAMLQEDNVRKGFFEHGEFVAFRNALPEYFKPVVTFAYYTGWRKQEILSLKWNQVDLNARTVRLDPGTTKNGAGRLVVLDGELLETIQAQWDRRKVAEIPGHSPTLLCPYVFHHDGKPIRDFRKAWYNARKQTGLMVKTLHDFRRTAVRNMVRAGVNERVAMSVSGHKTRSVFDRYNIVSEEDLKEAARRTWEHAQSLEQAAKVVALRKASEN
ncbi:MAG TPA: site-specific integrase, partial [Candidatus Binatia bacterium]|nr:site-specific integrase [Candidatus Binatia bacterium]